MAGEPHMNVWFGNTLYGNTVNVDKRIITLILDKQQSSDNFLMCIKLQCFKAILSVLLLQSTGFYDSTNSTATTTTD